MKSWKRHILSEESRHHTRLLHERRRFNHTIQGGGGDKWARHGAQYKQRVAQRLARDHEHTVHQKVTQAYNKRAEEDTNAHEMRLSECEREADTRVEEANAEIEKLKHKIANSTYQGSERAWYKDDMLRETKKKQQSIERGLGKDNLKDQHVSLTGGGGTDIPKINDESLALDDVTQDNGESKQRDGINELPNDVLGLINDFTPQPRTLNKRAQQSGGYGPTTNTENPALACKRNKSDKHKMTCYREFIKRAQKGDTKSPVWYEKMRNLIKTDKVLAIAYMQEEPGELEHVCDTLKSDYDVVMAAVKQDGTVLQYASETLKNNRDVVLAAVKQNGGSLEWASETLKDNRDVVMAAVTQKGRSLRYAS